MNGITSQYDSYVRAPNGIGIGRGGGIGSGSGPGIGGGFGGYVAGLRRKGLDVAIVIDGTGSMNLILEDVKGRIREMVLAIHRLVPTARVGLVVYGGKGDAIQSQPLTLTTAKLEGFLGTLQARGGGEWEEDVLGAMRVAVDQMDWRPYAKKVIVLVADSPPAKEDFAQIRDLVLRFHAENGTFNAIDPSELEHRRFEAQFNMKVHREIASTDSPLPQFYRQTQNAYAVLAHDGGGAVHGLRSDAEMNLQVMLLAFGEKWRQMVEAFGAR
jgi:hypothetical protein